MPALSQYLAVNTTVHVVDNADIASRNAFDAGERQDQTAKNDNCQNDRSDKAFLSQL